MQPKPDFLPVKYSQTILTELMIPSYANFGGKIHGGVLLSLMDKVAYVCAAKHAGNYCVTASIDGVDFLAPVEVGEMVSLKASVVYVGRTSLVVGIRVESENIKTREIKHTNTSYFTMVAKDETGKPVEVPGLTLETREQVRRFIEARRRKDAKAEYKQNCAKIKVPVVDERMLETLKGERCRYEKKSSIIL
ncbi:acyl-CoA thioesterase [Mucilaginibacter sp. RS28]|uniref:Acyl-CoA thioesterase n=1 Tax=Mucilaginibacter straminoryzae TaxID=2932774 RepID=A0A9X1X4T7_9SPHI|nr:acyl-CoA thioesterase [Mucilaginibacter straminoryzae]MCJ8210938.1 acyl-CoA thioesterase [Mucilaginibacter straminoryzae]